VAIPRDGPAEYCRHRPPEHDVDKALVVGEMIRDRFQFQTGRIGSLYPESETTFFAGREYLVPYPKDVRITFERDNATDVFGLTWHQNGDLDQFGTRLSLDTKEVTFQNDDVSLADSLFLAPGDSPHPAVVLIHSS
jgi:hypothetical protein